MAQNSASTAGACFDFGPRMLQFSALLKSSIELRRAVIISRTPVRVSFCGGGTDLDLSLIHI